MSLLIDALKRAEQEKHGRAAAPAETPGARGSLELAPIGKPEPAATAAPRTGTSAPAPKAARAPNRRIALWSAAGAIVVAIGAGGAYVWHSISALTPRPAVAQRPLAPIAPAAPAPVLVAQPETAVAKPASTANPPPALAEAPKPAAPALPRERARPAAPPAEPAMLQPVAPAERPRVPPALAAGYQALREGDLAAARQHYGAAFAADPASVDAILGLATVEGRSGRREAATALYRRALELDPRNPTALAGLAALAEGSRPAELVAQLRADIARFPDSSPLHALLGNAHAARGEWRAAQAAYFEAHRLDPANAEIAHNLAVSLDHLGEGRAAAQFYRQALEAARAGATPIDVAAVERRLAQITGDAPPSRGSPAER